MSTIAQRFEKLSTTNAPGQEVRQDLNGYAEFRNGDNLPGELVDFSHGDINAAGFEPAPGALEAFVAGVRRGGSQAYTEYRGGAALRESIAPKIAHLTGAPLSSANELILTPGSQGALFLAVASAVGSGDKVAIVQPDYFANRKLVEFLDGRIVPIALDYLNNERDAGLNLQQLESAFKAGARTFVFSNPNNPTGAVYSASEIDSIAGLANRFGATVIVDQLYSRLLYSGSRYTHLCASAINRDNVITIMGPSKTESLSGYRLGVAFGSARLIERMESLQAIVSLRAPGYCQAVLETWFNEPDGWLADRIERHEAIRDDLLKVLRGIKDLSVRASQAGSYLFPRLPALSISTHHFVRMLRLQANVIVTPGSEFGPHSTDSVRLNFSQNSGAAVRAAQRIATLIDRNRR